MIIDAHTHIGRNDHINASVYDLLKSMDESGIDKSLVFACKFAGIDNQYLTDQIKNYKDRLYGVLAIHIDDYYNFYYFKDLIEKENIKAVKFYLGYDHWEPSSPHIRDYLEYLDGKNIPVIFHCGDCLSSVKKAKLKYAHPLLVDDVAVDFPNINFVIAHIGNPWIVDTAEVCYKNSNVYTDISGFVYGNFNTQSIAHFTKIINEYKDIAGSFDKLIFGSDFPISNQKSYINNIKELFIPSQQESIFSGTAKKVFNL